ncbi:MAG: sensor histidine kinase [Bacillaceae bacterium]|nr:sensor histidine kinase [Bacillaceae bacterium]
MSYQQLKWLIIIIPSLTIGVWEFVRHRYLLPVISMELGNWLSPLITLAVSMLFLTRLFEMMEKMRETLEKEKERKAITEERERIAREIHDRIAQSLFFLNVKAQQIKEKVARNEPVEEDILKMQNSLRKTHSHVRQAITNLKTPTENISMFWRDMVMDYLKQFEDDTPIKVRADIEKEDFLTSREKVELFSSLQELMVNIQKHAQAENVTVSFHRQKEGWVLRVADDGIGKPPFRENNGYGINMIRERLKPIDAELAFKPNQEPGHGTIAEIKKERG